MKRFVSMMVAVALCAMTAFALAGCTGESVEASQPQLSPKVSPPTVAQQGVLRVGVNYANPPFSADANGKVQGIDVDLAAALAQEMGLKVQFVNIGNNGGADEIAGGAVDIVMAGASDGSAGRGVTVVGRYLDNAPGLFTVTTNGEPIVATMQDVESGAVAVQGGSVSDELIKRLFPTAKRVQLRTLNECFEALKSGQAKYVACDSYAGAYLAVNYENVAYAGTLEIPNAMGIAVSSSNAELQKAIQSALDAVSTNGVMALIKSKWVGNLPTISTETQVLTAEQRAKISAASKPVTGTPQASPLELNEGVNGANGAVTGSHETIDQSDMPNGSTELTPGANVSIPGQDEPRRR